MSTADADKESRAGDLFEAWRAQVERELPGTSFATLYTQTLDGLTVEPLYVSTGKTPSLLLGIAPVPRAWRGVARVQGPDPAWASARARVAVAQGADELWIEAGPDHGVHTLTAGDLALVLSQVDLVTTGLALEPGGNAMALTAALVAVADARGVPRAALRGGLGVDPLGRLARTGSLLTGLAGAMAEARELAAFARVELPSMRALRVDATLYHEAGADSVSQLAWSLSTGIAYLRELMDTGLSLDEAAASVEFVLPVTGELLPEMAKLRAMRVLWDKVVRAAGGEPTPGSMALSAHGALRCRSRRDRPVNMLRGTLEIIAGALGGADAILAPPLDAALGSLDEQASRTALMAHHVLRDEAHLARVLDPLAGSYALEALTDRLARVAWEEMQEIEGHGGMIERLRSGSVRRSVSFTTQARWRRISTRRQGLVGVSRFAQLDEEAPPKPRPDPGDWVQNLGRRLSESSVEETQTALMAWARLLAVPPEEPGALMKVATDAVKQGVDLFSLTALLREGRPSFHLEPLRPWRDAEGFEAFRDESDRWVGRVGRRPTARLLTLGPLADHDARAAWAESLFAAGGVRCLREGWVEGRDLSGAELEECDALLLCGTEQAYQEFGLEAARGLFASGIRLVGRVGPAGEDAEHWRSAGPVHFFHDGIDAIAMLGTLWESFGDGP